MTTSLDTYLPIPPRVWSRVQNLCTYVNPDSDYSSVYIPLTKQIVSQAQADYEEKMQYKGNILQYKANSAQFTKSQRYSQIAKGAGPNRTKVFATQSQTYSNPNTTGLLRVGYVNYPYQNQIVGAPNNISGQFAYGIPNPNNCSGNSIQDGGNLVCGTYANPCSGEIIQRGKLSSTVCNPASASNVPGQSILCWNNKTQTWFPRSRYFMNNSTNKWPINYKGFVAVKPRTNNSSIKLNISIVNGLIYLSWKPQNIFDFHTFHIYYNGMLIDTIDNDKTYFYVIDPASLQGYTTSSTINDASNTKTINKNSEKQKDFKYNNIMNKDDTVDTNILNFSVSGGYYTSSGTSNITTTSNTVYYDPTNVTTTGSYNTDVLPNNTDTTCCITIDEIDTLITQKLETLNNSILTMLQNGNYNCNCNCNNENNDTCNCTYYNNIFNSETFTTINGYLQTYLSNINVDTDISISLDEYNTLNVNLFNLGETMDPSCCFFNIIDIYKNILYAIKTAFDNKNTIKSTLNSAESWRQDSIILHNNQLLQDYINNLNNQMKLFSISTTSTAATIKPKYDKYIELYGIPPDLIFDPSLLSQIQTEYCL